MISTVPRAKRPDATLNFLLDRHRSVSHPVASLSVLYIGAYFFVQTPGPEVPEVFHDATT